jgi:pimeloyl-ACP methyl ester carboxylesterase
VSDFSLGQGVAETNIFSTEPQFLGRVQPYSVCLPATYASGRKLPLTLLLHSLALGQNQFAAIDPRLLHQVCDDRDSVVVTPLARGPSCWYFDEGELDVWEVWARVAEQLATDPNRTVVSGYSMGGYGAYKLGLTYPEVFAQAVVLAGPPVCGVRLLPDVDIPGDLDPNSHCARGDRHPRADQTRRAAARRNGAAGRRTDRSPGTGARREAHHHTDHSHRAAARARLIRLGHDGRVPEVRVGPLLRHVGETDATIWVETDKPCRVKILGHCADTFEVEGHHFAIVCVEGLDPDGVHPYEVHLDGDRAWPPDDYEFPMRCAAPGPRGSPLTATRTSAADCCVPAIPRLTMPRRRLSYRCPHSP